MICYLYAQKQTKKKITHSKNKLIVSPQLLCETRAFSNSYNIAKYSHCAINYGSKQN